MLGEERGKETVRVQTGAAQTLQGLEMAKSRCGIGSSIYDQELREVSGLET